MATRGKISTFLSDGGSMSTYRPTGRGVRAGTELPDGRIVPRPRATRDVDLIRGSSVRVTNPRVLSLQGKRNPTLGIGPSADKRY